MEKEQGRGSEGKEEERGRGEKGVEEEGREGRGRSLEETLFVHVHQYACALFVYSQTDRIITRLHWNQGWIKCAVYMYMYVHACNCLFICLIVSHYPTRKDYVNMYMLHIGYV